MEDSGGNSSSSNLFSSTTESLAVISEYHTLNKRLEQTENDDSLTPEERQKLTSEIKKQQEAMGGLDRYQKASIYGAKSSKFVCADWVVPLLEKELETKAGTTSDHHSPRHRLRVLDVGAIDNQYHGKGYDDWLDAVPIDLHGGQHESVLQVDFFDYAHEYCAGFDMAATVSSTKKVKTKTKGTAGNSRDDRLTPSSPRPFDAIVMSLVLNFQGDPRKRGDMLALASDPRLLKLPSENDQRGGMLFVALPSASLDNSRYCDLDRFVEVVTNPLFRLELVEKKRSSKLILLAFRRTGIRQQQQQQQEPPTLANDKPDTAYKSNTKNKSARSIQTTPCYNVPDKTFEYGDHEMKRLHPAKPGAKRNNFAVILKSSRNRTSG
eukprot:jgi/Psemu1/234451/estExt_Genewise1.C_160062